VIEAELQRLAEIMTKLAPKVDGLSLDSWQIVAAFVAGALECRLTTCFIVAKTSSRPVLRLSFLGAGPDGLPGCTRV
jgi:hypothetical protein